MSLLSRVILTVAVALVPVYGVDVYNEASLRRVQMRDVHEQVQRETRSVAIELDRIVAAVRNAMVAVAEYPALQAGDPAACTALLRLVQARFTFINVIAVIGSDGHRACASNADAPLLEDLSNRPPVVLARAYGHFAVAGFLVGRVTRQPDLAVAMPMAGPPDRPAPVLVVDIGLAWLQRELAARPWPDRAALTVADRNGVVLAEVPASDRVGQMLPQTERWMAHAPSPGVTDMVWYDGERRITGYNPLGSAPADLSIVMGFSTNTAFAAREAAARLRLALLGGGLLLAMVLALLLARRTIGQPVAEIMRAIHAWRLGEASVRVPVAAWPSAQRSDFARIAAALNDLLDAFEQTRADLLGREETLTRRVAERTRQLEAEIHEREQAQAALQQAQKMEVIGQLTGGIAHDFNNLLTAIIGNLELATLRSRDNPALARLLANATRAADRGAALTQRMLAFGRRQYLRLQAVALGPLLAGMDDLLARTIGATVLIELEVGEDVWPVRTDVNQLELLLLNLAINARDAMPDGGTLRIATRNLRVAPGAPTPAQLEAGDYVAIAVSDTGTGIDEETLARVMEPFFTTKPVGRGSGLGLSMAHGVAAQSGGGLSIESEVGAGTTVTVWLPRADAQDAEDAAAAEDTSGVLSPSPPATGNAGPMVLLVDDDAEVASVTQQCLRFAGYRVRRAESGLAALGMLHDGLRIDLLLADLAMPGMSGVQLAAEVRRLHPGMPVLLATGYSGGEMGQGGAAHDLPVLDKPFKAAQLLAAVARLLGG